MAASVKVMQESHTDTIEKLRQELAQANDRAEELREALIILKMQHREATTLLGMIWQLSCPAVRNMRKRGPRKMLAEFVHQHVPAQWRSYTPEQLGPDAP